MESSRINSLTGQVQMLLKSNQDFPEKLRQRLVLESNNVKNPFQLIVGLYNEGVLTDASTEPEAYFGFKEMIVQLAIMIACSKGADATGGLMKSLEGSGNLQLISDLQTWIQEDFAVESGGELSEPKEGVPAVETLTSEKLPKNTKNTNEASSIGFKLIDKIMSREEDDFMEQFKDHLIDKASMILNATEFCSSLIHQNVLGEADVELTLGSQLQSIQKVIKAACSKKAFGSLAFALQHSDNECVLQEALECEWLEAPPAKRNNYPIAVKSLPDHQITEVRKAVRPTFFKEDAPPSDLEKVATLSFVPESSAKGAFAVELDGEKMMASFDDGTVKLGNWIYE